MTRGSLLRGRDFRLVAGAVGLSALGDWVAIVALGLHVKGATDSGFAVAGLWVCLFGPSVLVAGHAGLLVDRIEATRLMTGVSLLGVLVAAVLGFTTGTAAVLALTALLGLVFAILQPAEFALVPPLAGDRIQDANGHVEAARYIGFGLGPLLGGGPLLGRRAGAGHAGRRRDVRDRRRRGAGAPRATRPGHPRARRAHATARRRRTA
jgi:predicted MFS family arabinose efflux permease